LGDVTTHCLPPVAEIPSKPIAIVEGVSLQGPAVSVEGGWLARASLQCDEKSPIGDDIRRSADSLGLKRRRGTRTNVCPKRRVHC